MRIAEVMVQMGNSERAIKDLKSLVAEYPQFLPAKNKLGVILYNDGRTREAGDQWESVLMRDPNNPEAIRYLKQLGSLRDSNNVNQ